MKLHLSYNQVCMLGNNAALKTTDFNSMHFEEESALMVGFAGDI